MWYQRILVHPDRAFFLFGARGTGKTSWLRRHFGDAKWFDLLDEALYQDLLADPGLFANLLRSSDAEWVVIDEVQRLPQLLNEVHRAIENSGRKFILTGSSARKLRRGGVNLLAGRASMRAMWPLLPEELGPDFELERALAHGTLPLVWNQSDPTEVLRAYTQAYLKEEIQAEALVRNLPGFARFLPVAALFHGQVLNTMALARDAGVARTTIVGYLDILEDTLIAARLAPFEAKLRVREKTHPKLYFIDPGLVRALKRAHGPIVPEERGPLFEGFVFTLLQAYRDYRRSFDEIHYWAPTQSNVEVDFLLTRGERRIAIEVKASPRLRAERFNGLRAVSNLGGIQRRLVVYTGERDYATSEGIEALSLHTFWTQLASGNLF